MILVTGGTGFIGSYILYYLLREHKEIRALKRPDAEIKDTKYIFKHLSLLEPMPGNETWEQVFSRIAWFEGDILDMNSLLEAVDGTDLVFHAAGMVSFSRKNRNKVVITNVDGTANVVNACLEKNVKKLAYVSSVAALARKAGEKVNENAKPDELIFSNAYSESKYRAEMEVWRGMGEGLDVVMVNPGIVLGWGDFSDGSAEMFQTVYQGLKFYPTGSNAFVDARDVAKTLVALAANEKAVNNRYILAGENLSYETLFNLMADRLKVRPPYIKVKSGLVKGVWLWAEIKALLTGTDPFITKDMALTSGKDYYYDDAKIRQLPGITFFPVSKTIEDTCRIYLETMTNH